MSRYSGDGVFDAKNTPPPLPRVQHLREWPLFAAKRFLNVSSSLSSARHLVALVALLPPAPRLSCKRALQLIRMCSTVNVLEPRDSRMP